MRFKLGDRILPVGVAFSHNDINYSANWLTLTTLEEKKAIGIEEIADPVSYDNRFYNTDGSAKSLTDENVTHPIDDPDGTYKKGDLMKYSDGSQVIAYGVKSKLIQEQKEIANSLLATYDWQVVRKAEKGIEIDSKIVTYRDNIRTVCTTREREITNCSDVDSLKTLVDGVYKDGKKISGLTDFPSDPYNPV